MNGLIRNGKTRMALALVAILAGCATAPAPEEDQIANPTQNEDGQPSSNNAVKAPSAVLVQPITPLPTPVLTEQQAENRMREMVRRDPLLALMSAEIASQRGDFVSANIAYTEAARSQKDPELAKRAVEISLGAGDVDRALSSARVWEELNPQDAQASRTVLLLLLSSNKVEEGYPALEATYKQLKEQESVHPGIAEASPLRIALEMLMRIPDKEKSYATGIRLLGNDVNDIESQYILSQLAENSEFHDKAIGHIQNVINVVPEERYYVLQAQFMERRDQKPDAAIASLEEQAKRHPDWFSARLYLARMATQANSWPAANKWFKELLKLQPNNYPLYSSQGFVLAKLKDRAGAAEHFNVYLNKTKPEERQNEILIYLTMAELSQTDKQYKEAIRWLEKAPNGDENFDIQLKLSNIYKGQDKPAQAEKILRRFKAQNEEDGVRKTLALAQLQESQKKGIEAAQEIDSALALYPDQPDLLYERAMVAERLKDLGNVEKYLTRLIEVKPENPHGYNALGYTWAENNIRLNEALELIKKANLLAPKDPFILDSLGWVHYRLGNQVEAENALKAAYAISPDEEIGLHLLELLITQGRTSEAEAISVELKRKFPGSVKVKELSRKVGGNNL
jgi:tetratricopeptide (TPR) repeat protein